MGFRHGPLTIKGRFKDKRYKDPSFYGVSYQMTLALTGLAERGNVLKFGFAGAAGKWFRYGFLEKPIFRMNKLSWVDYELTFFVVSENQPTNNYFANPEQAAPNNANFGLIAAANSFNSTFSTVPTSMPLSIAGAINGLISALRRTSTW